MMKTEYTENSGFLQRDSVEHKGYAEAYSANGRKVEEKDGAGLLEKVLNRAYKRVKVYKGASGVDGMTVNEAGSWLKEHKGELLEKIRNGKYKPSPVRRVEIPKDNGGVRKLGIPTVIDRIIQQAIAQVLTPIYEPKFSDGSYGYRPNRSAKDAIAKVREYADKGYQYAVCLDLSKYFDTLNHELLMNMLRQDIHDKRLIDLIKKYLKSGVMENGVRHKTEEGSSQGGNLSSLLANIILGDKGVLDSWDFLVSNLLLPLGSIAIILFCVWRNGWGWNEYLKEANTGKGIKMPGSKAVKIYLGVVLPILVFTVMILGLL